MPDVPSFDDPDWPPGTVRLATLLGADKKDAELILQPRPTDNPNDPLNWPKWQKVIDYSLASFYAMMVFAFVNATSVTWGPMGTQLGFSNTLLTNAYAIGYATLVIGAPMLIPFALKFGSRPVYVFSTLAQLGMAIWAANTETPGDWWGVNAVQCWLGALSEVLIQMTIAEVFFVHQRGLMNAIYIWVQNVGTNLAVVAAGYITVDQGWRWVWWWCAIFFAVQLVGFVFGFEETKFTHEPTIAGRQGSVTSITARDISGPIHGDYKDEKKRESTSDQEPESPVGEPAAIELAHNREEARKLSVIHINPAIPRKPYWKRLSIATTSPGSWSSFLRHSWQPFLILFTIPGVTFCSFVYAIVTAWQAVSTTAYSEYMLGPPWNFTASSIGLMSLPTFIGSTIGSIIVGPLSDYVVIRLAKRNDGIYEPEMRLWVFLPFIPFQLAGAWWFGYALADGSSWVQIALSLAIAYFGSAGLQSLALVYILDAYNEIIGDSLTALTSLRNALGAAFVFAQPSWIKAVGLANLFNTIDALVALVLMFAFPLLWYGKRLRAGTVKFYRNYAEHQFETRPLE